MPGCLIQMCSPFSSSLICFYAGYKFPTTSHFITLSTYAGYSSLPLAIILLPIIYAGVKLLIISPPFLYSYSIPRTPVVRCQFLTRCLCLCGTSCRQINYLVFTKFLKSTAIIGKFARLLCCLLLKLNSRHLYK